MQEFGDDHESTGAHVPGVVAGLPRLLLRSAFLDDIEDVRKRCTERLRAAATGNNPAAAPLRDDDNSALTGEALIAWARTHTDLGVEAAQAEAMLKLEHQAVLELRRALRDHPLYPWITRTKGVGDKQGARLIAAIGPVAWRNASIDQDTGEELEPARPRRGPAELWGYCGLAPGQKRQRGVQANWNAKAKMRAYLIAESCMKQRHSPYRAVYDQARANWADRDVTDGHKHHHALRLVAKAVLKGLFVEARSVGA